jgi:hypothetical protein
MDTSRPDLFSDAEFLAALEQVPPLAELEACLGPLSEEEERLFAAMDARAAESQPAPTDPSRAKAVATAGLGRYRSIRATDPLAVFSDGLIFLDVCNMTREQFSIEGPIREMLSKRVAIVVADLATLWHERAKGAMVEGGTVGLDTFGTDPSSAEHAIPGREDT